MVIEPPHPASKAKKAANVARLRGRRASARIAKATGGAGKLATAAVPAFGTVRSKTWAEMMQNLRREFDLDRQPEDVRDRIERAAWVYVHGGMNTREWVALRTSFAILTGKAMLTARPMATAMPAEAERDGW